MEGSDFYKAEAQSRFYYYPETEIPDIGWWHWTPTLWVDGIDEQTLHSGDITTTWSDYRDMISARRAVSSPLAMDIQVEYGAKADTGMVRVEVVATDTISYADLHLRLAIIESDLSFKGNTRHQVLRDYLPDTLGIAFSIAEGDTFSHSEDFVIGLFWNAENCKVVAFVQDDTIREVVQAVQGPVVVPVPEEVTDLTATLAGDDLRLDWSAVTVDTQGNPLVVDLYRVYRDTVAYFSSGAVLLDTTTDTFYVDDTGVVGDTGTHYFYVVTAVYGGKESSLSGEVGEMDINILSGK